MNTPDIIFIIVFVIGFIGAVAFIFKRPKRFRNNDDGGYSLPNEMYFPDEIHVDHPDHAGDIHGPLDIDHS